MKIAEVTPAASEPNQKTPPSLYRTNFKIAFAVRRPANIASHERFGLSSLKLPRNSSGVAVNPLRVKLSDVSLNLGAILRSEFGPKFVSCLKSNLSSNLISCLLLIISSILIACMNFVLGSNLFLWVNLISSSNLSLNSNIRL